MKKLAVLKAGGHMCLKLIVTTVVCGKLLFGFSATAQTETAPQPQEQNANDSLINLLHDYNPNINGGSPDPRLSAEDPKKLKQVRFYPNPTNGALQIDSGENPVNNWKVFDLQGRIVLQGQKNNTIEMGSLSSGTYLVQVLLENGEQEQELILKK